MTDKLLKLQSYTTKDPTSLKENDWYNYITTEEFRTLLDNNELFESTMYAGMVSVLKRKILLKF